MKKVPLILIILCFYSKIFGQSINPGISIIPEPVSLVKNSGQFVLPKNIIIESGSNAAIKKIADSLSKQLSVPTGYKVTVSSQVSPANTIRFLLNSVEDKKLGKEGYTLEVSPQNVLIKANQPAGLFYAVQTFLITERDFQ